MPKTVKAWPGQGILSMATANFDSWMRSPRTLVMLLFIAAICYLQMCGYKMTLEETGYAMHFGETIFNIRKIWHYMQKQSPLLALLRFSSGKLGL